MTKILTPFGKFAAEGTAATPATGTITVNETGVDSSRITTIDIADLSLIVTTNANKGDGKLLYTLPAGDIIIKSASIALGIDGTGSANAADTPDLGLGTVVASGSVAVLSGTATFENIMTGQTVSACDGTVQLASVNTILTIASSAAHTIYLNIADGWAGVDAGMLATGRVVIEWQYMS